MTPLIVERDEKYRQEQKEFDVPVPMPKWLDREFETPEQKLHAQTRFFLRIAAIYASEAGNMPELAKSLGYSYLHHFPAILHHQRKVTVETAIALEKLVGRKVLTREQLRPDIFKVD